MQRRRRGGRSWTILGMNNNDNNGIAVDGRILFRPRAWEREQVALGGGRERNSPPKNPETRNNAAHNSLCRRCVTAQIRVKNNGRLESPGISVFPAKLEVFQLMTNDNLRENSQNKVLLNCYFATLIFFCNFCSRRFLRNLAQ